MKCDASDLAIGYVLGQKDDQNREYVVAYGGKALGDAEKKYYTSEKECLAIIRGVESYRPYLANSHFTIVTDHSALTWLKTAKLSRRLERWALKLQDLDYDIIHRPGKNNVVADCLSRRPYDEAPAIQSVTNARQDSEPDSESECLPNGWQTYTTFYYDDESPENCPVISALEADQLPENLANPISLFEKQKQCPDFSDIITYLQDRELPEDEKLSRAIVSESPYYSISNGILYHLYQRRCRKLPKELRQIKQIVLPTCLREDALHSYHDSLLGGGHLGADKVYSSMMEKY